MRENNFTPGPWYATADPDRPTWWISQQPEGGTFWIAEAVDGLMNDETEPNARLIAAAPDLLEACEVTYSIRADCRVTGETSPRLGCVCKVCQAARLAVSAIAKARGE